MMATVLLLQVAASDPCGADARCRVERARAIDAEHKRAEYYRALEAYAEAIDRAEQARLPHRERHPLGADWLITSSLSEQLALVGYTVAWPLRVEFFGGVGKSFDYSYEHDPMGSTTTSTDSSLNLTSFGAQARWFLGPWMFSPYATTGLGWSTGSLTVTQYTSSRNGPGGSFSAAADVAAHRLYAGAGLDFQWESIHVALGYRLAWAFYTVARDPMSGRHIDSVKTEFQTMLDDAMHSVSLELGVRY
jgi:hypothetical protein